MIKENLEEVHQTIKEACIRSGRDPADVTLICVSKTKPVSMIQEAYEQGERYFGENKVQELGEKYDQLPKDIHWHMIGHLQRNKVKDVVGKAELIHSVDSLRLAQQISEISQKKKVCSRILLEVNAAQEESKFGFLMSEVKKAVADIAKLPNINICGLMTIAPFTNNPESNRKYFTDLHKLYVDISEENYDNVSMSILSMGMTGDYQVAVEEGANMVRVGTGIFGARNYNINE